MRLGKSVGCVLVAVGAGLLTGCMPNGAARPTIQSTVTVKSIMEDADGYASRQFSTTALPDQVRAAIVNVDSRPVGFGRLVLDTKTETRKPGSLDEIEYVDHSTYENLGNGLVRSVETMSTNGIQTSIDIDLSYRNLVSVRSQMVTLSQTYAPRVLETRALSRFDPITGGNHLSYAFSSGFEGLRTLIDGQKDCTFGAAFNAADLNPKIAGTGRYLDCQYSNQNGVVTTRMHYAYLDQYGFAILLGRDNATAHVTFTVTNFDAT